MPPCVARRSGGTVAGVSGGLSARRVAVDHIRAGLHAERVPWTVDTRDGLDRGEVDAGSGVGVAPQPVGHSERPMQTLQTLLTQWDVLQSAAPTHARPRAHRSHVGPPQSTSLSLPFWTPSLQVAGGGTLGAVTTGPWEAGWCPAARAGGAVCGPCAWRPWPAGPERRRRRHREGPTQARAVPYGDRGIARGGSRSDRSDPFPCGALAPLKSNHASQSFVMRRPVRTRNHAIIAARERNAHPLNDADRCAILLVRPELRERLCTRLCSALSTPAVPHGVRRPVAQDGWSRAGKTSPHRPSMSTK